MRSTVFALALLCVLNTAAHADSSCATDKRAVAPCYQVHGRLRVRWNLRLYLWPVGTKRLLAVHYAPDAPQPDPPLPPNLAKVMDPDHDVFGDFRVCPFTPEKAGKMRIVCIDSASHLITRPKPRYRPSDLRKRGHP